MQSTGFAAEVFICILIHASTVAALAVAVLAADGHSVVLHAAHSTYTSNHMHTTFISAQSHLVRYLVTVTINTPR